MKEKKPKETRAATWTAVVYPESAPENWRDLIDEQHVPWVESPLHDKDKNADGELKKSHYHILFLFGTLKSFEQVMEFTTLVNGPIPQRCHNARALVRYMAHLDNPDKEQYEKSDIKGHQGADVAEMLRPAMSERYTMIADILEFIDANELVEFKDIMDYSRIHRLDDWFPLLCDSCAIVISNYIRSCRHKGKVKVKVKSTNFDKIRQNEKSE